MGVVATDSAGQTATISAIVPVEDDPPPVVAVVAPPAEAEIIEGSRLTVAVGAADDQGVSFVELSMDGTPAGFDAEAPYQFSLEVPTGITELRLTALAEDLAGQQFSVEHVLTVAPDPLTTASGRVIDAQGQPVAERRCAVGRVAPRARAARSRCRDCPTVSGRIACSASVAAAGGTLGRWLGLGAAGARWDDRGRGHRGPGAPADLGLRRCRRFRAGTPAGP